MKTLNLVSVVRAPGRGARGRFGLLTVLLVAQLILSKPPADAAETLWEVTSEATKVLDRGAGEGPAWHPELGILFSGDGGIMRLTREGKLTPHRPDAGTNGLLFDAKGRLLACEPKRRRVTRTELDGSLTILTDAFEGKKFNTPNDVTVDSKGRIYFSDPRYGPRTDMQIRDAQGKAVEGVYRIDTDGTITRVITHEVDRPNGLLVTPDDRWIFVADNNNDTVGGARKFWRFRLQDGRPELKSRTLIFDWGDGRGPDGMAMDTKGRLYVAGGLNTASRTPIETNRRLGGVYVFSPDGQWLDFVRVPNDEVTNCAFGGDDGKTLYITAGGALWSIRTATPGQVVWPR